MSHVPSATAETPSGVLFHQDKLKQRKEPRAMCHVPAATTAETSSDVLIHLDKLKQKNEPRASNNSRDTKRCPFVLGKSG
jgi:hypothetical protein